MIKVIISTISITTKILFADFLSVFGFIITNIIFKVVVINYISGKISKKFSYKCTCHTSYSSSHSSKRNDSLSGGHSMVDPATRLAPVTTIFPTVLSYPFWSILPVFKSPCTFPISHAIDRPSKATASAPPARISPTRVPATEAIVVSPFGAIDWVIPVLIISRPVCGALWIASFLFIPAPLLTSCRPTSALMIARPVCDALQAAIFASARVAALITRRCPTSSLTISKPLLIWSHDDLPVIHHMAKFSQLLVNRLYCSSPILLCAFERTRSRSKLPCSIRYTVTSSNRCVFSITWNFPEGVLLYSIVLISPLSSSTCFTIAWWQ